MRDTAGYCETLVESMLNREIQNRLSFFSGLVDIRFIVPLDENRDRAYNALSLLLFLSHQVMNIHREYGRRCLFPSI